MKFDHIGIPTTGEFDGEIELPNLQMTVSDHQNNPFGIQWQRYWDDAPYPDLVKTVPHVAFEVYDLPAALQGQRVIIEPNSPSLGVTVAFVEVNGGAGRADADRPHRPPRPLGASGAEVRCQPCCSNQACIRRSSSSRSTSSMWVLSIHW
jgi:hypothetical protein